ASRTSSSLNGLMIAVTSFIGLPRLESLADRQHDRALAGVLGLSAAGVQEAVELTGAAITLRVGVDVSRAQDPAAEVLRHAELPVGVAAVVDVLQIEVSDVADQAPTAAEVVRSAEIDVIGVLGARHGEVIVDRVEELERQELPRAADVDL